MCLSALLFFFVVWNGLVLAEEKTAPPSPATAKATPEEKTPTPKVFLPVDIQELEKKGKLAKPPKFAELTPREKMKAKVSVNFQNKNLLEVAACLTVFSGLDVVIDPDVSGHPDKLKKIIVYDLQLSEVPLEQVFTWLCRYLNAEYRLSDKTVYVFRSYAWLKTEPIRIENYDVTGLFNDIKGEDIVKPIKELLKLPRWFNSSVKTTFVSASSRALVQLPATEAELLRGLLKEMQKNAAVKSPYVLDMPGPAPLPEDKDLLAFEQMLDRDTFDLTWEGYRRIELLKKIAEEKKIQLGFCQKLYSDEERLTFKDGKITLRKALDKILPAESGMQYFAYSANSAWIGPKDSWYPRTAESLREQVVARAYPVRELAGVVGGKKLVELITKFLPVNSFSSPAVKMFYHEVSGCLVVVHLPEMQIRVDYYLKLLASTEYKKYQ
jgi:hypothetical protein